MLGASRRLKPARAALVEPSVQLQACQPVVDDLGFRRRRCRDSPSISRQRKVMVCSLQGVPAMSSRTELEGVWKARVDGALQLYEESTRDFYTLVAESSGELIKSSIGRELIRQARRRESAALKEYMRILRTYTDVVAHGTLPEESSFVTMDRIPGPNG